MAGGGGKGGKKKTETQVKLDPDLKRRAEEVYEASRKAAGIGFAPNRAPRIAAFTPQQLAAMNSVNDAAAAFGMDTAPVAVPEPETVGGMSGYSTGALYDEAMSRFPPEYLSAIQGAIDAASTGKAKKKKSSGKGGSSSNNTNNPFEAIFGNSDDGGRTSLF